MLDTVMRKLVEKGYAKQTIQSAWQVLHQILDYAVYPTGLIPGNPSNYIKVPRSAPRNVVKRSIISPEDFAKIMERYPFGAACHIPLMLLYHTGMRIGEVMALCWPDVDLENGVIDVWRQCKRLNGVGYILTEPKTSSSKRKVRIDRRLVDELQRWKKQQKTWEKEIGDSYCVIDENTDHVLDFYSKGLKPPVNRQHMLCTSPSGRLIGGTTIMRNLQLLGFNSHSFRHTQATLLSQEGAPPRGVAYRLGHKNPIITGDVYTHNTDKMQEDTLLIVDKIMQTKV